MRVCNDCIFTFKLKVCIKLILKLFLLKNDQLDHFLICMATKDKNSCLQNVDNCFLDCYIIRYIAIKNTLRIWQNRE